MQSASPAQPYAGITPLPSQNLSAGCLLELPISSYENEFFYVRNLNNSHESKILQR